MARKQTTTPPVHRDSESPANKRVLRDRQARIDSQLREIPDLGLDIAPPDTAAEFLRDAWDKKVFGDEPKTITRIVYGPDPLIDTCPQFKEAIETHGKEAYAEATAHAILKLGHRAVPDPVMQKGLFGAIKKYGAEQVAAAFRERILNIPERQVEYEQDGDIGGDPLLLGSNALRDCVARYGEPGKAYKFLSPRCIDVLGMRGYTLVLDKDGDPVKAGTLFMAWIPQHVADRRRAYYAQQSEDEVRHQQENFIDTTERFISEAGKVGAGSRPLRPQEILTANAANTEEQLGGQFEVGVKIDREA